VLALAPKQTTPRVSLDKIHTNLTDEKKCTSCHSPVTDKPFPPKHPNKERCLLYHKRKK